VIRESIEISVSAGSAILEVRSTPARNAARMLRYLVATHVNVGFTTCAWRLRGDHHILGDAR
jgi:hypothetical protein